MRTKYWQGLISSLVFVGMVSVAVSAQPAKGANKFLGNITTNSAVRSDFLTYWNQITPENESKWGTVEGTRGTYKFAPVDSIKNFAEKNNIPWKLHCLIWGSQYPSWLTNLSQADQLTAITKWLDTLAARYPNAAMIDVVNEAYPQHKPAPFKAALGGDGTTGYDWLVNSFKMARQRWPKAILIYNDYNTIEYSAENTWLVTMVTALKKANAPIDAIGCQGHDAYKLATATVKGYMDKVAALGLPMFITEYDIGLTADSSQLKVMKEQFTMFWNYPQVVGVTYWGYLVGSTWRTGTGLLNTNGTERPALTWLKNFVAANPNPPNDFPTLLNLGTPIGVIPQHPIAQPTAVSRGESNLMAVYDLQGRRINSVDRTLLSTPGVYIVKQGGRSAGMVNKVKPGATNQ